MIIVNAAATPNYRAVPRVLEYIDEHDVHTLVPRRKLSFTDTIMADLFRCPNGATRGTLTVDWDSYHHASALSHVPRR